MKNTKRHNKIVRNSLGAKYSSACQLTRTKLVWQIFYKPDFIDMLIVGLIVFTTSSECEDFHAEANLEIWSV